MLGIGMVVMCFGVVINLFGKKDNKGSEQTRAVPCEDHSSGLGIALEQAQKTSDICRYIREEINMFDACVVYEVLCQRVRSFGFVSIEALLEYVCEESESSSSDSSDESDDETSITVRSPAGGVAVRKQSPAAMSNK